MPPHLVGSLGDGILSRIEEGLVVDRPHHRTDALDVLGECLPLAQILDLQAVLPVAGRIGRVGQPVAIVAHGVRAEREELLAFCQRVEVEEDFLGAVHAALAAAHVLVLLSFLGARVVEVVANARRDAQVGLLDASEHLGVERLLKALGGLHHLFGIRVLALEVFDDLGVTLLAQPEVVVRERVAVDLSRVRPLRRDRWLRRCRLLGLGGRNCERNRQKRQDERSVVLLHALPLRREKMIGRHSHYRSAPDDVVLVLRILLETLALQKGPRRLVNLA